MNNPQQSAQQTAEERCNWVEDSDGNWATACGCAFCLDPSEPPEAHGMKFCCYCGRRLASFAYKECDDEDDLEDDCCTHGVGFDETCELCDE